MDEEEDLIESLNMLGQIARCKYEKSCAALIEIFDPITDHYQVNIIVIVGKKKYLTRFVKLGIYQSSKYGIS